MITGSIAFSKIFIMTHFCLQKIKEIVSFTLHKCSPSHWSINQTNVHPEDESVTYWHSLWLFVSISLRFDRTSVYSSALLLWDKPNKHGSMAGHKQSGWSWHSSQQFHIHARHLSKCCLTVIERDILLFGKLVIPNWILRMHFKLYYSKPVKSLLSLPLKMPA